MKELPAIDIEQELVGLMKRHWKKDLTPSAASRRVSGMTKNEEIEALKKFAASLPKDSYLYAAISYLVPQFESDIRSDIISNIELRGMCRATVEAREQYRDISKLVEQKKQELQTLQERADGLNQLTKKTKAELEVLARNISRIL